MLQASIHGTSIANLPIAEPLERELSESKSAYIDNEYGSSAVRLAQARSLLRLRRERDAMFGGGLFSDPAWDILLALYITKLQQARVKVISIIEESGVPPTTGLRWLTALIERGVVERTSNPTDARSTLVEMSDRAALAMTKHLFDCRKALVGAAR